MTHIQFRASAAAATMFLALTPQIASSVTFSDTDFLSQDWTPIIHVRDDEAILGPPPLLSGAGMTRQGAGGNPGAFYRSFIGLELGDAINTTGIYIGDSYDPRDRAISSLDYVYDVNHNNASPGTFTDVQPALLQSGRLFVGPVQSFSGAIWVERSVMGLVPDDFVAADIWFSGEVIRPDFSGFGDPIQFGYSLSNRVEGVSGIQEFRGVDNWSVTINEAPLSDVDGDGVDELDFDFWTFGFGTPEDALLVDGDFNRDGLVDGSDFLQWQREFGDTGLGAGAAVPEPTSSILWCCGAALLGCRRVRRHRQRR